MLKHKLYSMILDLLGMQRTKYYQFKTEPKSTIIIKYYELFERLFNINSKQNYL